MTDADMARRHAEVFLGVIQGKGFAKPNPTPMFPNPPGLLRLEPYSAGLRERIWWGAGTNATAEWAAKLAMNLQSSTLKIDESDKPFHVQQAEQIRLGDDTRAIFGRSYAAEPDVLIDELKNDEAIAEADTLLLTVPNQLGVDYNAHVIEAILKHVAPGLGWRFPKAARVQYAERGNRA